MIHVRNTPSNAGVAVSGDFHDLEALYDALHTIVGPEGEHPYYKAERFRVLSVCYDLRHALMGDRGVEFVDNGMDRDKMKRLSMMASEKNIYYTFHVYWPEMLFVHMVLDDFVKKYVGKKGKNRFDSYTHKEVIWDKTLYIVRGFQAAVVECIRETVPSTSVSRVINLLYKDYSFFGGFTRQYLDELNIKYLKMDAEQRLKMLPTMAKRLSELGDDYRQMKREIAEAAHQNGVDLEQIELVEDYPEVEW